MINRIDVSSGGARYVAEELPEREILAAINEHRADLMVTGAHGMAAHKPIGSKAQHVLAHSSLLLLPARE